MSSTNNLVVIVTAANRGIGRAICDLILQHPQVQSKHLSLHVTSRSGSDFGLKARGSNQKISYHSLDISDESSIKSFESAIQSQSTDDKIDILINNAGVNLDDRFSLKNAQTTLESNYRGTLRMCRTFIPHLKEGGRIVNLSSTASTPRIYSDEIANRFRGASKLEQVETLAKEFISALEKDSLKQDGWPTGKSYSVSKACVNAFTAILAKENPGVVINCCCPGWVNTDMGSQTGSAPKTPEEGARIPVHLAFDDLDGVTGKYWGNDSISSRDVGKVQSW